MSTGPSSSQNVTGATEMPQLAEKIKELELQLELKKEAQNETKREKQALEAKIGYATSCPVCWEQFSDREKEARYFGCHCVCDQCLSNLLEQQRRLIRMRTGAPRTSFPAVIILCPSCQQPTKFREGTNEMSAYQNIQIMRFLKNL